jgi:hypothetical protein
MESKYSTVDSKFYDRAARYHGTRIWLSFGKNDRYKAAKEQELMQKMIDKKEMEKLDKEYAAYLAEVEYR